MRSKDTESAAIELPRCLQGGIDMEWGGHKKCAYLGRFVWSYQPRKEIQNYKVKRLA